MIFTHTIICQLPTTRPYPQLAAPMHAVINNTRGHRHDFHWDSVYIDFFNKRRLTITTKPLILDFLNPNALRVLSTNASDIGVETVPLQECGYSFKIIYYFSHLPCPSQRKYATIERETLALGMTTSKLRPYLLPVYPMAYDQLQRLSAAVSVITRAHGKATNALSCPPSLTITPAISQSPSQQQNDDTQKIIYDTTKVLFAFYDHPSAGYCGRDCTFHKFKTTFDWSQMYETINLYIKSYHDYAQHNIRRLKPDEHLEPIAPPTEVFAMV
ncbi:unnamed protein product, partial [Adineta steineri]